MGRKKKAKKAKKSVAEKKPVKTKESEKKPEVFKQQAQPGIRTVQVSPEDRARLLKAEVNYRVHCNQCPHKQSYDDIKAIIVGTYVKDGEKNVNYNFDTGVLTITKGKE